MKHWLVTPALMLSMVPLPGAAEATGAANVVDVEVEARGDNAYRFDVTVASEDTGWDYYADGFEVLTPDGEVLGTRTLHHPHEDEQPFTRSLRRVEIPAGIDEVRVRAHHSEAGYDGRTMTVAVPR